MQWIKEEWSYLDKSIARWGIGIDNSKVKQMSVWSADMLAIGDFSSKILIRVVIVEDNGNIYTIIAVQRFSAEEKVSQCALWFENDVFDEVIEALGGCKVLDGSREDVITNDRQKLF